MFIQQVLVKWTMCEASFVALSRLWGIKKVPAISALKVWAEGKLKATHNQIGLVVKRKVQGHRTAVSGN